MTPPAKETQICPTTDVCELRLTLEVPGNGHVRIGMGERFLDAHVLLLAVLGGHLDVLVEFRTCFLLSIR